MADEKKKNSAEAPADEEKKNTKEKSGKEKKDKTAKSASSKDGKEKKDKAAKSASKDGKDKKPNIFVRMGRAIKKFFKDLRGECKKVVWPDRKTVLKSTGVVLVSVAVLGVVIWGIDTGLSELIKLLLNAAQNASEDTETTTAAAAETGRIIGFLMS